MMQYKGSHSKISGSSVSVWTSGGSRTLLLGGVQVAGGVVSKAPFTGTNPS